FQALEDEVHAELLTTLHAEAVGPDVIFVLNVFLGPLDGDVMIAREGFDPLPILVAAFSQSLFGDGINSVHIAEKVDHMRRTGQQRQISLDDDTVKTVVYKNQQAAKQFAEGFHRSS